MRPFLFGLLALILPLSVLCQDDICRISEYQGYMCKKILVFESRCSVPEIDNLFNWKRLTPSKEDAENCDKILNQFKQIFVTNICKQSNRTTFFGQLIGYSDENSSRIFVYQLIILSSRERIEKLFPSFNQKFIVGFGGKYEEKTFLFKIDIERKSISLL